MVRSRGKKDNNQDEIVQQCRNYGMMVYIISQYPGHLFDLLIGYNGRWLPFEVKKTLKSKLTEREADFWIVCTAKILPLIHATSFDDVVKAFEEN